ncbi:MAG: sugar phosphate isomerase/epimerase [Candidatus Micrarchaeota archaeon]|nr:sugar phosphate isomerase/epimerase [Candidatus Micrarchaeota archaeon]
MIVGAMNNPHKNLVEQIYFLGELNFEFFELTIEYPAATPKKIIENKKRIADALESYNLGLLAHLPWYFNLAHPYERIQQATNKEIEAAAHIATTLGAKILTIHPDLTLPQSCQARKKRFERTLSTLKSIEKITKNFGLKLCLETVDEEALEIKEYKEILEQTDIKITLDAGHAHTYFSAGVVGLIEEFKKDIAHVHLHDGKKQIDHLPLGVGTLDMKKFVEKLKEVYNQTITLEVHCSDPHYLAYSKDILEIYWYGKEQFEENKKYIYLIEEEEEEEEGRNTEK